MADRYDAQLPRCGARTKRSGAPCSLPAGWGVDGMLGFGQCRLHGGTLPTNQQAAAAAMARAHVASLTGLVPTEPHEAFEWLLARQCAIVEYYDRRLAELTDETVAGQATVATRRRVEPLNGDGEAEPAMVVETRQLPPGAHVFIKLRDEAADRLADYAKLAAAANVAERRVRIEGAKLDAIAAVLNGVMRELRAAGLDERFVVLAGEAFRRRAAELEVVTGTAVELAA